MTSKPYEENKKPDETPPNADKFNEEMQKVQKNDESDQYRQRPMQTDDEEEEMTSTQDQTEATPGAFESFMSDNDDDSLTPTGERQAYSTSQPTSQNNNTPETQNTKPPSQNAKPLPQHTKKTEHPKQAHKPHETKKAAATTPHEHKATTPTPKKPHVQPKAHVAPQKTETFTPPQAKKAKHHEEVHHTKHKEKTAHAKKTEETPEQTEKKVATQGEQEQHTGEHTKDEHAKAHAQTGLIPGQVETKTAPVITLPTPDVSEIKPYATLKPHILEFFERILMHIGIMKEGGIEKTSVELHMPGSIFDGAKIELSEYDTAKGQLNLTLSGSPEAVAAFEANRAQLEAAFKSRNLTINMGSSSLRTSKARLKKVSSKKNA